MLPSMRAFSMTFLWATVVCELTALWAATIHRIGDLPARVPTRFGFDGQPVEYGPVETFWILPVLGTVLTAAISFLATRLVPWARERPERLSMPLAELFRGLPPEARAYAVEPTVRMTVSIVIITLGIFVHTQFSMLTVAMGARREFVLWPVFILVVLMLLIISGNLLLCRTRIRAETRRLAVPQEPHT
jgi:hypothetical protein